MGQNRHPNIKIAVASGKGGTGKTTVAVNLFAAIKKLNAQAVTLSDCDVEEPNAQLFFPGKPEHLMDVNALIPRINKTRCTYCGDCAKICAFNAIMFVKDISHIQVMPDLCKSCGACLWACRYDAIQEYDKKLGQINLLQTGKHSIREGRLEIGSPFAVPVIRELKKQTPEKEIVIYDSPPGTSCPVIETIHDADFVIVVAEPTPFGLSDLKLMTQTLKKINKTAGVVINRAISGQQKLYDYLKQENLPVLMEIPFDRQLAAHYSKGNLFVDVSKEYDKLFHALYKNIIRYLDR
ncbi:MAG: ATP-binding protein [Bacteroidales bacterium]